MKKRYANIVIDIVHEKLDRTFQYRIPAWMEEQIQVGMEVIVPFGRGNRDLKGYVIELTDTAEYEENKIKEILQVSEMTFKLESQMIQLAAWIRDTYGSTMIQALKTVLPLRGKIKEKEDKKYGLAISFQEAQEKLEQYRKKNARAKIRLLEHMLHTQILDLAYIRHELGISSSTLQAMLKEGVLVQNTSRIYRNPVRDDEDTGNSYQLTEQQEKIVKAVVQSFQMEIYKTYLLHGITGSGKTEVYVEIIAAAAAMGKQSIVLIPEIALTRQTVARFYKRFGSRVSVIHSRLSKGEKYDQFQRARNGELDVIIGPRSALFTPFLNLGFIIIDEEHEMSYKSENVPKYHARETAQARAAICGASVILGSATPSMEAYTKALKGEYELLELQERISSQGLAEVYIEDMRKELRDGNRSIFSRRLKELIHDRLLKKEQILLFLNRRGYAGFVSCRSCGNAVKCPHCDVSLSLHKNGMMLCHYCGYEQPAVSSCPVCGSQYIGGFRVGTEQVEELVSREFPTARILRMDMDTTRKKHGHEQIVAAFTNEEADIMIGTQMIVKGHDFPKVTLVGILAADMSLQVSDYTAAERTFQLLTQAAGRAGRGKLAGEVVIQTYNPEHYAVLLASKQDYKAFYRQEMMFRKMLLYPPAGSILQILLFSDSEEAVKKCSDNLKYILDERLKDAVGNSQIIGPAPAVIAKLNDQHRRVLYIKSRENGELIQIRKKLEKIIDKEKLLGRVQIQFDISG